MLYSGSTGTVGYVGWSTGGGYGLFLNLFGLGADQIVGAKLVDAKGDIVDVKDGDELIKGIRGAGAIFGVVVELTIKVYPLKQVGCDPEHTLYSIGILDAQHILLT